MNVFDAPSIEHQYFPIEKRAEFLVCEIPNDHPFLVSLNITMSQMISYGSDIPIANMVTSDQISEQTQHKGNTYMHSQYHNIQYYNAQNHNTHLLSQYHLLCPCLGGFRRRYCPSCDWLSLSSWSFQSLVEAKSTSRMNIC